MNDYNAPRMVTVDVHTHFLPEIDDGAGSLEESVRMLRASYRQGVRHMWATPHFYPRRDNPDAFLKRRAAAAERVLEVWEPAAMPAIYLGAEVEYYPGISMSDGIRRLCIGGTKYILVEMPSSEWSDTYVEDLLRMRYFLGLWPIIAHIERSAPMQAGKVISRLANEGILFQLNAGFLGNTDNKRRIKQLLKLDALDLIATDCHNMTTRLPNMREGLVGFATMVDDSVIGSMQNKAMEITMKAKPLCAPERV